MKLDITRIQSNNTFNYCSREYTTDDNDIIYDFLEVWYDEKKDLRSWIEVNLPRFVCLGNKTSIGYSDIGLSTITYNITFVNDKDMKHFISC